MENNSMETTFVPCTPAGSMCFHLESKTRQEAIARLLKDAAHMPYKTWDNFERRGYTIAEFNVKRG